MVTAVRCSIVSPTAISTPRTAISPPAQAKPAAGTVDDRLDGEADRGWQTGEGALVQQAPGHGCELALELIAAEPEQEART